jgi:hypothetical protein
MIFTFDPPETGWTEGADAVIVPHATAPTQPNALRLLAGGIALRTLSGLVVGEIYQVWARVNFDDALVGAAIRFSYNEPGVGLDATIYKDFPEPADGWELRYVGLLDYSFSDRIFRIYGWPTDDYYGTSYVDEIWIGEDPPMPEGDADMVIKKAARHAASAIFGALPGVAGRVQTRYSNPDIDPDNAKPWGVFKQLPDSPTEYDDPGNSQVRVWRATADFYFEENAESDPADTSAADVCDDFEDNAVEALRNDPTLGGTVHQCRLVQVAPSYGEIGDYASVSVVIEITQVLAA